MAQLDISVAAGQRRHLADHGQIATKLNAIYDVQADFGAKGDGSTDDGDAIQAALDAAEAVGSGSVVFFPPGTYRHTSQLRWKNGANLLAHGGTATVPSQLTRLLYDGPALSDGAVYFDAEGATNVQFLRAEGVQFNANGKAEHCIAFDAGAKVDFGTHFTNCQFVGSTGDGLAFDGGVTNLHLSDVRWDACRGYCAAFAKGSDHITIDRFTADNSGGSIGFFHLDNTGASNNHVQRVRISNARIEVNAAVSSGAVIVCTQQGSLSQKVEHRLFLENLWVPPASGVTYDLIKVVPSGAANDFIQIVGRMLSIGAGCTFLSGTATTGPASTQRILAEWVFAPFSSSPTADQAQVVWQGVSTQIGTASAHKVGFHGVAPIAQQTLATGAGASADDIITALQNLGLVKQS